MTDQSISNNTDRRDYFRIDDSLSLCFERIEPEQLPQRLEQLEQGFESQFTLMSNLASISQHNSGILHHIENDYPDVAAYLKVLDHKINLLGQAFLMQHSGLASEPAIPVNLSASGLAFQSGESLPAGTLLELRLILLPEFTGILNFAEVVASEANDQPDQQPYIVRVNFTHMRESDRDLLIRHVVCRQGELLRRQREQREDGAQGGR